MMLGQGNSDLFGLSVLEQRRGLPVPDRDAGPFCGAYTARAVTIGGDSHDRQRMAQETPGKSAIVAGNPDDGLRLRSVLVRTVFEAARLPHLDIRLPHRPGRQGVLRTGLRLEAKTAERGTRPDL